MATARVRLAEVGLRSWHLFDSRFLKVPTACMQMITQNFEDYPEHRLQFFALLHSIVNHCFGCVDWRGQGVSI